MCSNCATVSASDLWANSFDAVLLPPSCSSPPPCLALCAHNFNSLITKVFQLNISAFLRVARAQVRCTRRMRIPAIIYLQANVSLSLLIYLSLSLSLRVVINCNKIENSRFRIIRFHFAIFIIFFAACCSCKFVAAGAAAKLSPSPLPSQVAHSKNIFIIFITIVILARKVLHSKSFVFGQLCCGWQASEGRQAGKGEGRRERQRRLLGRRARKLFMLTMSSQQISELISPVFGSSGNNFSVDK